MLKNSIIHTDRDVKLKVSPINPAWILEGEPVARNVILSRSADMTACTIFWDCTAGKFNWHYEFDETVHILEGSVTVSSENSPPKRLEAGDVAFFPVGTVAHWHVENYVRKVAFCRRVLPKQVAPLINMARWARGLMRGRAPAAAGSLMEA
jgi:uncharacterized cupin superfamily protein